MLSFLFYIFSSILLISSLFVIITTNPVYSVFYLILGFCNASAILLLFELEFLGFLLLIVYVGAIAVLFLFVVIMLNVAVSREHSSNFFGYLFFAVIFCSFFVITQNFSYNTSLFFQQSYFSWFSSYDSSQNVLLIANVLYSYYFVPFLLAGFVLLIAMVGAIVLTLNPTLFYNSQSLIFKKQKVYQQLSRQSNKAVFLFKRN
uniref:NADH-ubiquinone oxidoreductase chain 6 n=2 Tax=Thraustochytriidae TaxID=33674 RepID=A0A481XIU4_9STRA|nr:NADH dehydrogenase subunit 6 [Schizochytrium sp. TIO1101]QBK37901.1 NADH dehydrogenase subunit 6 [Aurantiochytrium acetophilum]